MPEKAVYLLVIEGFADWEPAHAVAELRRHGQYRVESVGLSRTSIQSMGGIRVVPSTTVTEVDPADVAVFILPGGDRWEKAPLEVELTETLKALDAKGVPLAAICGATLAIAQMACGEKTRTSCNCGSLDGLETWMGSNFGRCRDGTIPGPFFSRAGCTALGSVTGKRIAAGRHLLRSCSTAAGVTRQVRPLRGRSTVAGRRVARGTRPRRQ